MFWHHSPGHVWRTWAMSEIAPLPLNRAPFKETGQPFVFGVQIHSGHYQVHSFNPTIHRNNECTTNECSMVRKYPQCTVRVTHRINSRVLPTAESFTHPFSKQLVHCGYTVSSYRYNFFYPFLLIIKLFN